MTDRIMDDARNLKKLVREAEALADESLLALAKLKAAMIAARQNPAVHVATGQSALMRLAQAESQALAMSTNLLRLHGELSKVAREVAIGDEDIETVIPEAAVAEAEAQTARAPIEA